MHHLIIGNSIAAAAVIEGIRSQDQEGAITVVGEEKQACYARPLISYLLQGKTDEERMRYRDQAFFDKHKVTVLTRTRACHLDAGKKTVALDDGTTLAYDKLVLATGSSPFIPPMEGLEQVKNRFTFLTLDDAHELTAAIKSESRVLILGAGLIGLKCAEGLFGRVHSITVVDLAPRILASILDEKGSANVQAHLQQKGLTFHLSDRVKEFTAKEALLESGTIVGFDILVVAVGVKPNTELAKEAGLMVNRGIVVDHAMRTSVQDIWAAGDCAEAPELVSGCNKVLPLLCNAYLQGETAGKDMAGLAEPFTQAIAMNAISFFGLHVITAGLYEGEEKLFAQEGSYKRLFVKDNHLVGYILIGKAVERAGIYTALIRNQTALDTIDFDLISRQPALMAFAKSVRQQQLGGSV